MIALGALGFCIKSNEGFPERLSSAQNEILNYKKYDGALLYRTGKCFIGEENELISFASECYPPDESNKKTLLIWGDSFAAHLYPGLKYIEEYSLKQYTTGCAPILGLEVKISNYCVKVNEIVLSSIKNNKPQIILLSANWQKHYHLISGLSSTVKEIKSISPQSKIVIVGNAPQWEPTLPDAAARLRDFSDSIIYVYTPVLRKLLDIDKQLEVLTLEGQAVFFSPLDIFCLSSECFGMKIENSAMKLIAHDYGHFTQEGSNIFAVELSKFLK